MKEYKNTKLDRVVQIFCTVAAAFILLSVILAAGYELVTVCEGVTESRKADVQDFKPRAPVGYSDDLTVPVEQEITKVMGGIIREPMKDDLGSFYETGIKYNVYVDSVKDTVFAEVFVGRVGLLINLVDTDGNDKPYSSEDLNQLTAVSINEDGLFYILEDVDTGVQYIVSRYNSYLVR